MTFKNPIIPGFYPDPSVCRVGDDYYLVTSTFEYFPGVPIFHSKNLINWKQIGHVLTREEQLPLTRESLPGISLGIFAPTLRYHEGRFYMITTNMSNEKNFYVWADNPEGPWSDSIIIEGWGGIDPSILFDEDGKVFLTGTEDYGEQPGIYQAELDIETGKLLTKRRFVWEGTGGRNPEAPHLYKIGDWYHLLLAEGGTDYGHMVTIARSKDPFGPFESNPNNPILSNRSTDKKIQATGHADLIQTQDGDWWAVFLGIRPIGYPERHHLGRETYLAPVIWNEEGWPVIGDNGHAELEHDSGNLSAEKPTEWGKFEDFDAEELSLEWNFYRNPIPNSWSLTQRPGWLTLNGKSTTLSDIGSPCFVGRRQQHFNCKTTTLLEFDPIEEGEEAGLTTFMNEYFHYEIAKTMKNGKKVLLFRRRLGTLVNIEHEVEYDESSVVLGLEASDYNYTFTYQALNGEKVIIGKGETSMLAKEVAGGFVGVYIGMYATGNGKDSKIPAYFDYFNYEPLVDQEGQEGNEDNIYAMIAKAEE